MAGKCRGTRKRKPEKSPRMLFPSAQQDFVNSLTQTLEEADEFSGLCSSWHLTRGKRRLVHRALNCPHIVTCHSKPSGARSSLARTEAFYHVQPPSRRHTPRYRLTCCQLSLGHKPSWSCGAVLVHAQHPALLPRTPPGCCILPAAFSCREATTFFLSGSPSVPPFSQPLHFPLRILPYVLHSSQATFFPLTPTPAPYRTTDCGETMRPNYRQAFFS